MKSIVMVLVIGIFFGGERPVVENIGKTCVSEKERLLYDLIMEYRKSKGLHAIPFSAKLTQVAQTHARDLSENFDLNKLKQCNLHSWSKKGVWTSCCYTNDHKEASCMWDKPKEISSYNAPGYEIAYFSSVGAEAKQSLASWQSSPSHNPVIINQGQWSRLDWQAIGVGIYNEYAIVWFGGVVDKTTPAGCH